LARTGGLWHGVASKHPGRTGAVGGAFGGTTELSLKRLFWR